MACVVCKKESIPFDRSRSFHKFPKDTDLRTKWMIAIGKLTVKATWKICSDHFDAGSFHDTDGYTTLRRLLPTAVPRVISSKEVEKVNDTDKLTETIETTACENFQSTERHGNVKIIEENEISQSEENTQAHVSECIVNVDKANLIGQSTVNNSNDISDNAEADYTSCSISPLETAEHIPYNDLKISHDEIVKQEHHQERNILKRKVPFKNKANRTKKICYRSKFKTYCFTRAKFSSDAAWEEFQEFAACMKNKIATAVKKNSQMQKKLTRLKMVIEKLKMTNIVTVAEYLKVMNNRCI